MAEFRMPSLGADMERGTLLQWHVRPGDSVHKGDIVAEVDTAKAAIEVECFDEGTIGEILVPEGATVPVGTILATIETGMPEHASVPTEPAADTGSEIRATPLIRRLAQEAGVDLRSIRGSGGNGRILRSDVARAAGASAGSPTGIAEPVAAQSAEGQHIRASGYARRMAAESGVELSAIHGTGPGGAVQADDVRAARTQILHGDTATNKGVPQSAVDTSASDVDREMVRQGPRRDMGEVRRAIATAMTQSKQTIPHYYLSSTIDLAAATSWLRAVNEAAPVADRIIMAALQLRAVALAAREVPGMNGHWIDNEFRAADTVDIGVIVSLRGGGIIAPTIAAADVSTVPALMAQLRGAVGRARAGRLLSSDTRPAGLTVTNLGEMGVESVIGVIPPPQVAIVGFGAVSDRPCAVNGLLGVRPQVTVTLAADHRASDGAVGARFLNTVAELLQHPERL
ncbi:2-oxo acid dehydrogenase subunit E2 [Nocardia brasiliensis]|uniref:2-oxo acid dehydrogenase subunit E2 n=1 Tax=Nocardia brasiliensis TaxID=37326 RepID=UPI002458D60D|nr:2-oxo acid dehydrogenase subunit E2 [Nocardia brasiliensis]